MWAQNGISGKKQQQEQARLRKMWKFGYAETIFGFFRWAKWPGQWYLPNRYVPSILERIFYEDRSNINRAWS